MSNRTFIIVALIMVALAAIVFVAYLPARMDIAAKTKVSAFPMNFGSWHGKEIELDKSVFEILETNNLFVREYTNSDGQKVSLYIVYSEDNRKVSHPPEVCLMGGGETITDKTVVQVTPMIKGTRLVIEKAGSKSMFVYWFKAGDTYSPAYLEQQARVVIGRLFGKRTAGALIRLSADIDASGEKSALEKLQQFSAEIEPLLRKYVP